MVKPGGGDGTADDSLAGSLALQPIGPAAGAPLREEVVVVSGLPRSGTSMMMQMLDAGGLPILTDGKRAADESNQRGYYEFEPATRTGRDNAWVADAGGKGVKIVAQLLEGLPPDLPVRVVFMQRPLGEVLASQSSMLKRLGRDGAKLADRQLADVFRKQVDRVARALANRPAVSLLPVEYHDALADPGNVAKRVNAFLGGGLDEAQMAGAIDPALRREGLPG